MMRWIRPRMPWMRCHFDSCPGAHGATSTCHSGPGVPHTSYPFGASGHMPHSVTPLLTQVTTLALLSGPCTLVCSLRPPPPTGNVCLPQGTICIGTYAWCAPAHRHGVTARTRPIVGGGTMTTRTVWRGPPHQEDTNNAPHENASLDIGSCRRCWFRNFCPAALGTCRGPGLSGHRTAGGRRAGAGRGRSPTAGRRLPCGSRGRDPASGGVWICAGLGRGILRVSSSAMETPPLPLAPLVMP